jgi:RNA polymerase-binding transcription factor DksA
MATPKKSAKKAAPGRKKVVAKKATRARKPAKPAKRPAAKKARADTKKAPRKPTAKTPPAAKKAPAAKSASRGAAPGKSAAPTPAAKPDAPATKARAKKSLLERKPPARKPGSVICPLSGFEVMPTTSNLSAKTVERLRRKLVDERERHLHQAEELQAEAEALAKERDPGDTQFDEESGEGDTVNVERERDLMLSASARQIVEEIDWAMGRIKAGKYGLCEPADRRIALERLEAIPYAKYCVDCKARAERRR